MQLAWEHIGAPSARADYDAGLASSAEAPHPAWAAGTAPPRRTPPPSSSGGWTSSDDAARDARSRARSTPARSFGHPGGSARQHYLDLLRTRLSDPVPPTPPARSFVYDGPPPLGWSPAPYVRRAFWLVPAAAAVLGFGWWVITALASGSIDGGALMSALLIAGIAAVVGVALAWPLGMLAFTAQSGRRTRVTRSAEDALRHEQRLRDYPGLQRQYEEHVARIRPVRERVLAAPYADETQGDVPADIRLWLERARAEEATARELLSLGPDFTVWSDVAVPGTAEKVDHLVLGFQGLFVVDSGSAGGASDWTAEGLAAEHVADAVKKRARTLGRALGADVAAIVLVVDRDPGGASGARLVRGGSLPAFLVARSRLAAVLGSGLPEVERGSRDEVFAARSRLVGSVPFV